MARCWLHQRWRWLLLILLSGFSWHLVCCTSSTGSSSSSSSSNTARPASASSTLAPGLIALFLREQCHPRGLDGAQLLSQLLPSYGPDVVGMVPKAETCEERTRGLEALVQVLSQRSTRAVVAQLDYETCEVADVLARLWNKLLVTWTCPQVAKDETKQSSVIRLSPSPLVLGRALAEIFLHFRWKTVSVIGVAAVNTTVEIGTIANKSIWFNMDEAVVGALQAVGIGPRKHILLPFGASKEQIRVALEPLRYGVCRAIIVCLPLEGGLMSRVLIELNSIQESRPPSSIVLVASPLSPLPFLPSKHHPDAVTSPNVSSQATTAEPSSNIHAEENEEPKRFVPPQDLGRRTLDNLLTVVPFDQRYEIHQLLNGTARYEPSRTIDQLREALDLLLLPSVKTNTSSFAGNKMYTYGLLGYGSVDDRWQPIVTVAEGPNGMRLSHVDRRRGLTDALELLCEDRADCPVEKIIGIPLHIVHIVAVVLGFLVFALTVIVIAALIRRHLLKKRMSKGPYKIILRATDFVFPQIPDARRVDEGIEAMLCCWLQQLQEFGGPEVDKPDLLQGSVGSLRPHLQPNSGSPVRHLFNDPRARYNGDLVQLKQLPVQGAFELKGKAMDVLVTIHGLRHENLNPLIGCLTKPERPCLVYEYCSRGSLEDVLVQDEVKLDWSFRLSLLTDLVRGMKYLHGTPIRAHGYLTSRNCVIDARWVLKVTDYGLPAFYEAQNIQPLQKTARELLWTAPEVLRHPSLLKRGSQPADVYSFGIIMQEVVVRGEPFCMLSLSPEDIIEKVKKPPPLIRPSVSKGAAPPEAINIMRQCWAENADMRPDFNAVHDLFKKLNHGRKVNFVDTMFQMLEKYSNNLEDLIRERTEQLDMEKKKTEQLLNRMLPSSVAEKLKLGMPVDPEEFAEVTIYFSDIVGFTTISAYSTPFQVVDLLNDLYTCFDATINAYNVYKVETIGDAYMVVAGCPVRIPDHASQIATMALDLLHQSGKFKLRHLPKTQLRLRIGLHTGPCCAGVVGLTMPRYCLFGDTVNTASRMESTGAPWRIHLSQATRDRLNQSGGYYIEYRGRTEIKGKGKMPTYWLLGKQGFDKELPVPPPLGEDHGLDEIQILENLMEQQGELSPSLTNQQPPQLPGHLPTLTSLEDEENSSECSAPAAVPTTQQPPLASPARKLVHSEQSSMDKGGEAKRVTVSVHDDRSSGSSSIGLGSLRASYSSRSVAGGGAAVETRLETTGSRSTPDYGSATVTKSTSGDNPMMLGTPVSATEVAAALLGASSTSINSMTSSMFRGRPRRMGGIIDEDDLSTPYNHYRCLSPNEHNGIGVGVSSASSGRAASVIGGSYRLLRRQFSLDRADEPSQSASAATSATTLAMSSLSAEPRQPRLFKQNSAGAVPANDLERIEEVPGTPGGGSGTGLSVAGSKIEGQPQTLAQSYRQSASVSLSVESLMMQH